MSEHGLSWGDESTIELCKKLGFDLEIIETSTRPRIHVSGNGLQLRAMYDFGNLKSFLVGYRLALTTNRKAK